MNLSKLFRKRPAVPVQVESSVSDARKVARKVTPPASSANQSISCLSKELDKQRSLRSLATLFKQFSRRRSFRQHQGIYHVVVRRLASAGSHDLIEEILEDQKQYDDIFQEGFNARLIALYGKSQMYDQAKKVFDEMPGRNCSWTVLSFNSLLGAALHSNKSEECLKLFVDIPMEPDVVSYGTLMKSLIQEERLDLAVSMLFKMEDRGLTPNLTCYNIVLHGLYKHQKSELGDKIWDLMIENNVQPSVVSYTSKAIGYALGGDDAAELIESMEEEGIKPDIVFFESLISNYVHQNNLEEAKRWHNLAQEENMKFTKGCYEDLVRLACEKSDSTFAFQLAKYVFIRSFPVDETTLQHVVDCLVREGRIHEAEEVVRLGKDNDFCRFYLKCNKKH